MRRNIFDFIVATAALALLVLLLVEGTSVGAEHAAFFRTAALVPLAVFAADAVGRLASAADRRQYLRRRWTDALVAAPLLGYVPGIGGETFFAVARLAAIGAALAPRLRESGGLLDRLTRTPMRAVVVGFLCVIGTGTVLLMLPPARTGEQRMPFVDALFTATSATCVTGLAVQDTALYFTRFGQTVLVALMQIGGLGIMTASVSMALLLRKQLHVGESAALRDALDHDTLAGARKLVLFIVGMTALLEFAGGLALCAAWWGRFPPVETIYHAFFHAVSAFCNAGFSTFSDSLVAFRGHAATNLVVCALIVMGGLGFTVIRDLVELVSPRSDPLTRRLRVQSRVVLAWSAGLIVAGAAAIYLIEHGAQFAALPRGERLLAAVFQSVTARTAGFNTCDIGALQPAALFVIVLLMFVGASPGSTGGGIKTTTAAILCASSAAGLRRRERTEMFRRTIPADIVHRATTMLCVSLLLIALFTTALLYTEHQPPLEVLFEAVSAFGTVGLSTGLTPRLSMEGRLIVTMLMFVGRLGPLTVAFAFARRRAQVRYEYAEERIAIG